MDVITELQHKMSSKTISFVVAILAVLFLVSAVSALTFTPSSGTLSVSSNQVLTNVTTESSDPANITVTLTSPSISSAGSSVTFAFLSTFALNSTTSQRQISLTSSGLSTLAPGSYSGSLIASGTNGTVFANNGTFDVTVNKGYCSNDSQGGNLTIRSFKVTNNGVGTSSSWKLLDDVTVEVKIKNADNSDVNGVQLKIALIDPNTGKDVLGDMNFVTKDDQQVDLGDFGTGDEQTYDFEFKVPADFNTGSNYKLVVKAYSSDRGENKECSDVDSSGTLELKTVDVVRQSGNDKKIAFDNIDKLSSVTCGDTVNLGFDAVNVGSGTRNSQTQIDITSPVLGINTVQLIKQDLSEGDRRRVNVAFTVPNVKNGLYQIALGADYDYSNGIYQHSLSDSILVPIQVIGCAPVTPVSIIGVSAVAADSGAKAGDQVTIQSTVTNTGNSTAQFIIGASGYDSWATLNPITDRIVTLAAGQSKAVSITLNTNKAAAGAQTLSVDIVSGEQTASKTVSVTLAKSASGLSMLTDSLQGNAMLWVIALINVILVIVIIIVAVKVARR